MKERYIHRVQRELHLPAPAKKEIVRDLNEIFSSAMEHGETEQQVIERLGVPKEFADCAAEQFGVDNRKKRAMIRCAIMMTVAAVFLAAMIRWSPVLFQRGNPIPYLIAATKITRETPYVPVDIDGGVSVYIAKRGECPELFEYVEESRHVEWIEQGGSGYIFSNGVDRLVVNAEVYWSCFTVWQVPNRTLAAE